jgi:hypothetical protein
MKLKLIFTIVVFSFAFLQINAQVKRNKNSKPKCAVKGFSFDCPEDFFKKDAISAESLIFKGNSDNLEAISKIGSEQNQHTAELNES